MSLVFSAVCSHAPGITGRAHLADPARFRVEGRRWRGQRRHYYTVPWGPYYIWGATARILRGLADRLAEVP